MSETRHKLDLTKLFGGWAGDFVKRDVSESALADMEAQIKAIREKVEPKRGDVVQTDAGYIKCYDGYKWKFLDGTDGLKKPFGQYRFNINDVLNQGEIVIGMPRPVAERMRILLLGCSDYTAFYGHLGDALACYRKGQTP